MKKLLRLIDDHFEEVICVILFIWVIALIFFQVVDRYALPFVSVPWTEEIARYSSIWMIFLGASACVRYGSHLQMDVLKHYLPKTGKHVQSFAVNAACIVFFVILFPHCLKFFEQVYGLHRPLPTSGAPEWIFKLCLPVMCVAMIVRCAENIVKEIVDIKRGGADTDDDELEVSAS